MFRPYKPREYASTKDVVTRLFDQAGGIKRSAHILDRSPTQTTAYSDPGATDEITFDMVRRLVESTGAAAPAEDLAALAGGVFISMACEAGDFEHLVAALRAITRTGDGNAGYVRAPVVGALCALFEAEPDFCASEKRMLAAMSKLDFEAQFIEASNRSRKGEGSVESILVETIGAILERAMNKAA